MTQDEILRFPLKRPVVLLTPSGTFLCRLTYAGPEHLVAENVTRLWESIDGFGAGAEKMLRGTMTFARRRVVGYRVVHVSPRLRQASAGEQMKAALAALEAAAGRKRARLILVRGR